eukprot:360404-Chlamydomonas_euryale.AAC.2
MPWGMRVRPRPPFARLIGPPWCVHTSARPNLFMPWGMRVRPRPPFARLTGLPWSTRQHVHAALSICDARAERVPAPHGTQWPLRTRGSHANEETIPLCGAKPSTLFSDLEEGRHVHWQEKRGQKAQALRVEAQAARSCPSELTAAPRPASHSYQAQALRVEAQAARSCPSELTAAPRPVSHSHQAQALRVEAQAAQDRAAAAEQVGLDFRRQCEAAAVTLTRLIDENKCGCQRRSHAARCYPTRPVTAR